MSGLETALRTLGDRLRDHSETITALTPDNSSI
jgi:hypothetical protein